MNLIDEANQTLRIQNHRYRYHLSPNSGWSNDPNGLVFYQGKYHVFLQNDPFNSSSNRIFWAHFVSTDLIKWKQIDFALAPDSFYDIDGCYSGSAIVEENKLFLVYAGHKNKQNSYVESICVAESSDGIHFEKWNNNPIITRDPNINTKRFRDPKIFKKDNHFFIIVGGESNEGGGQLLLYQSKSIYGEWHYVGKTLNKAKELGNMIECPDYFSLNGENILLGSPKGIETNEKHGFDSCYYLCDPKFAGERLPQGKTLDYGWDFYAPQTMYDPIKKRRLLFGWLGLPIEQEKESVANYQNIGALTIPRELVLKNDKILMFPVSEYEKLRDGAGSRIQEKIDYSSSSEFVFSNIPSNFEFHISSKRGSYGILVKEHSLIVKIHDQIRAHQVTIDNVYGIESLSLYIDNGLTELFINNGEYVCTNKCEFESNNVKVDFENDDKVVGFNYKINSIF